ncbi:hypothetical protein HYV74_04510 [Candidatus Uhrbacteria bacterium]|nr:hypothetical protein [Candidatus Uhrbacteria bacterium]
MMDAAIRAFPNQFLYQPQVGNEDRLDRRSGVIVAGMGGSALAPELLRLRRPELDLLAHRNYGLPHMVSGRESQYWCIASSYSGNTEETLDALQRAEEMQMPIAVIAVGGVLLDRAIAEHIPYVQLPDTGIQPRSALGLSTIALVTLLGDRVVCDELHQLPTQLRVEQAEADGRALAMRLRGKIPIIISSQDNAPVGYNWKIKCNETGKIPAFASVLPELNHNEMTGFDAMTATRGLVESFVAVFLQDVTDHPRVRRRMEVCADLYAERGMGVERVEMQGASLWQRVFQSLLLADWTAFAIAEANGAEAEQVPMVEDFKRRIRD